MSDTKYPTGRRVAFKNSTGVEEITANGTYGPIEVRGDLRAFNTYVKKAGATQVDATVKLMATNYPAVAEGGAGDLTLASHDHNMKRWYRWWLFYAGVGVKRCFYYSIDHDQFGIGSLWTPAFFKQLWAEMVEMLTDGSITRINQLWDGRIAYIRDGQRFVI